MLIIGILRSDVSSNIPSKSRLAALLELTLNVKILHVIYYKSNNWETSDAYFIVCYNEVILFHLNSH